MKTPIRSKVVINNKIAEQVNTLIYRMLIVMWKRCSKQITKGLTDDRNHQSSSKTFQRPEANKITNMQYTSNTYATTR
jgi:hypothetical protein